MRPNPFERIYQTDPMRERDYARENKSIERSDEDFFAGFDAKAREKYEIKPAKEPENNAKDTSKALKSKAKKVPVKRDKPAVAGVQKKL